MNTEHHPISNSDPLEHVLAAYLRAVEEGREPDRDELLRRHPDLAEELAVFLDNRQQFERVLQSSAGAPPVGGRFGDYELLQELGRGGMGVVYKARQVSVDRTVALKMVLAGRFASPGEVLRFRLEAEASAQIDHPHIVPLYEVGQWEGQQYFTMKLIEGGNLTAHLSRFRKDIAGAAALVEKVASALHAAHRHGILHRDLKPANILLDAHGEPYITDFGLAKRLGKDEKVTETGAVVGTASYMAPEQAAGHGGDLTTAVDIHALGVILHELLTGAPPFRGVTPLETLRLVQEQEPRSLRTSNPAVDTDLEAICLKCLEKDPVRRYASAGNLADDLGRWGRGEPTRARPVGRAKRFWRWCRRHPGTAGLIAASLLLFLLAFGAAVAVARSRATRLEDETLTANVYAAQGVASTILWQLDRLSRPVLDAAADPQLAQLLAKADREGLQRFVREIHRRSGGAAGGVGQPGAESPFQSWHILDGDGILVADSVENPPALGEKFRERDYFQGAVLRASRPGRAAVHISRVYRSRNDNLNKFAIAVAVPGRPGFPPGVIAATLTTTATLGSLDLNDERRTAVLVGRRDASLLAEGTGRGQEYVVLLHPAYSRGDEAITLPGAHLQKLHQPGPGEVFQLPDPHGKSDRAAAIDSYYEDPVRAIDPRYRGRWLAGFAPVGNTEFVVIVQQRYDQTIGPEHSVVWNMTFWAGTALVVGTLLIGSGLRFWFSRSSRSGEQSRTKPP